MRQAGKQWVEASMAFKKIKEETEKAKIRAKQTHVGVYLDGMWKERGEVKATRKEAKAAGLLQEDADDDGPAPGGEKKLDEQIATDPYIQVALHLLKDGRLSGGTVGVTQ
jgi:carboxyl-terminal processing protease